MSKPKEYSAMTKDKLMLYTLIALAVLTGIAVIPFGYPVVLIALITVGVSVGVDVLLAKVTADSPLNIMSAAVFALIVTNSYTLGLPAMGFGATYPLNVTMQGIGMYAYPALIALVGMVLFKKVGGIGGRKLVNPAAAAKLLVLVFLVLIALVPAEHTEMFPPMTVSLGLNTVSSEMAPPFGPALLQCFGNDYGAYDLTTGQVNVVTQEEVLSTMTLMKYHGWAGGVSSIAVIIVGLALFAICRRYIKWRITAAYLVTVAVTALALSMVYADTDPTIRLIFHVFIGSSIFLAFFMATDPATTPLTYTGQLIFGVGLGVLSVLIVTYMTGFFGGSILALVIMNLTCPLLDKIGKRKPTTETKEPKLPKAKSFTKTTTYQCMRCGACMRVCCHGLSPILIKQAFDKEDVNALVKLNADFCTGCGHCSFVCPSRIDLKGAVLRSKAMLRQ